MSMVSTRPTIENVSGFLGVGSLQVLGIFLILDGTSGFLTFIEEYASTTAWSVFVVIPLLVVSYVIGLISSLGVQAMMRRFVPSKFTPELFKRISESGNDVLMQKYVDAERHGLLLHGCIAAFVVLAFGSLAEVSMMGSFGFVGHIGFVGGIAVSISCPFLIHEVQNEVVKLSHAVLGPTNSPEAIFHPPNKGFNRAPESSGPAKPGKSGGGAGSAKR